jgi:hypothetical protein
VAGSGDPCIYCGNPSDSEEHIFATWIITEISNYVGETLLTGELSDDQGSRTIHTGRDGRGNPTFEFTTDQVCRRCNNEWMNRIDDRVHRYLPGLIRGGSRVTNRKFCKAVAAWAVKTAVTARFAHLTPIPVEKEWTSQLRQDETPSMEWIVWAAHYRGSKPIFYRHLDLNLEAGTWGDPTATIADAARFDHGVLMTFVVGQFCVQVLRVNGPALPIIGATDVSVPVWPPQVGLAWPPRASLDDASLEIFSRRFRDGMHLLARNHEERGAPTSAAESTSKFFVSTPITNDELATEDSYVFPLSLTCGVCDSAYEAPHDTGKPLSQMQLPYSASIPFTCPTCGDTGSAEITLNSAAGPAI